ncbi:hypothetical protein DAPPUDRAFT_314467 [Daphnia pulex]|uniref:Uncharacterized protein n=1 Tax=Daphnia pulex TaxID=6669 RepID=E9G689_DAPPU|nr:hypothetical protein DAPPUDRAFT_314467 [Daphnia pulex]|eukprot:EFX85033.1 hypothetical protein DAPPUDRAFT_314467 [Daphnia pulex]
MVCTKENGDKGQDEKNKNGLFTSRALATRPRSLNLKSVECGYSCKLSYTSASVSNIIAICQNISSQLVISLFIQCAE